MLPGSLVHSFICLRSSWCTLYFNASRSVTSRSWLHSSLSPETIVFTFFHSCNCLCNIRLTVICMLSIDDSIWSDFLCPHLHIQSEWEFIFSQREQIQRPAHSIVSMFGVGKRWEVERPWRRRLHSEQSTLFLLLLLRHHSQYHTGEVGSCHSHNRPIEVSSCLPVLCCVPSISCDGAYFSSESIALGLCICVRLRLGDGNETEFIRCVDCLLNVRLSRWQDRHCRVCRDTGDRSCKEWTAGIAQVRICVRALVVSYPKQPKNFYKKIGNTLELSLS